MAADAPVDRRKVQQFIEEINLAGLLPEGGVYRPVYSSEWAEARKYVARWMDEGGLEVREDPVGNLYGRLRGKEPEAVVTGSHIDTVKQGGKYDGALGIVAGMIAVQKLKDSRGQPRKTLEVLATCEEEGSRFAAGMWGARAITGVIGDKEADRLQDSMGITIGAAMLQRGYNPQNIDGAQRDDIAAFIELHIEQGQVLESEGVSIGIVEAITGITQLRVRIAGQSGHAGTTPMNLRRDPLVALFGIGSAIVDLIRERGRPGVATIGSVLVTPGSANVIPAQVEFTVDIRHPEDVTKEHLVRNIKAICQETAARDCLHVRIDKLQDIAGIRLNPEIRQVIADAAHNQAVDFRTVVSGAGHDTQIMARRFRTGMIFVPSVGGHSHTPVEFTAVEDIVTGINVLADTLHRLAY